MTVRLAIDAMGGDHGLPVTIRLLDPPLHEFLPSLLELSIEVEHQKSTGQIDPELLRRLGRVQELHEQNPMLGMRGCRLGIEWPEIYRMQVQAIIAAAIRVKRELGDPPLVEIMIPLIAAGVIDRIKKALGIPDRQLSATLGLSSRTMTRLRKSKRRLPLPVGDRLYRLARTFTLALDVLEDADRAREWLHTPQIGLNHRIPLEVLATEAGAREVEDLLRRIDLGVLA